MGYDAACTIKFEGQTARGRARLEHKDLVFRGPFRLAIPLPEISEAKAEGDTLTVRFGDRQAELEIGSAAATRWARRITSPPSRLDKLGIKAGMRVVFVNLRDDVLRDQIERAGATVLARRTTDADAVFLGARTASDLERLAPVSAWLQPAGAVWVVRRKGDSAVSERASMAAGKNAGLVDVKVVSFSDTHTAEKYVIPVEKRPSAARPAPPSPRARGSRSSRARSR
jgi:hypothetical protein